MSDHRVIENLPVRMDIAPTGLGCKVEIQNMQTGEWLDISQYIQRVTVDAQVGEATKITVEFIPHGWITTVEGVVGEAILLPSPPETNGSETP